MLCVCVCVCVCVRACVRPCVRARIARRPSIRPPVRLSVFAIVRLFDYVAKVNYGAIPFEDSHTWTHDAFPPTTTPKC